MKRAVIAVCAVLLTTTASADRFISNSIKYRDTGHQPATGRSGGASIEALSMIDKAGVAEVEIAAAAPGTIEHVQIKTGGSIRNYQADAATFVAPLPGSAPGTPVGIQAMVKGTAGARAGVIEVSNTVLLRPDLRVMSVGTPPTAAVGEPVPITAFVIEQNGDLGARATCALRVDGQTVDRATNIWVNAHGGVTCSFLHAFDSAGEKLLEVVLEDVSPRDYDPANQQASRTLRVTEEPEPTDLAIFIDEFASWQDERMWSQQGHTYERTVDLWGSETTLSMVRSYTRLNMDNLQLRYSETSGGQTVLEMDPAPLQGTVIQSFRQCRRYFTPDGGVSVVACQEYGQPGRRPYDQFSVSIRRDSTDATYYSHEAAPEIDGEPAYDREYYTTSQKGPQVRFGDSVRVDVEVADGAWSMRAVRDVPLELTVDPDDEHFVCWEEPPGWCLHQTWGRWMKRGTAYLEE